MATEAVEVGGSGGVLAQARLSRSDLQLVRKAVNGGYNLTPEQRQDIVRRAHEILMSPPELIIGKDGEKLDVSYRDQIAAAKVLIAADKMDMDVERLAKEPAPENHLHLHADASAMTTEEIRAELGRIIAEAKGLGTPGGIGEPRKSAEQSSAIR